MNNCCFSIFLTKMEVCLLLIYGIPASGKTLLIRQLLKSEEIHPEWNWLAVHFDDFYPPDIRTQKNEAGSVEKFNLKQARYQVGVLLQILLTVNLPAEEPEASETTTPHSAKLQKDFAKFIQYLNTNCRTPALDENGRLKSGKPTVIMLDDNMPLRSMRHEYYKVARNYRTGFAEVCVDCPLPIALTRNATRITPIPNSTISGIAQALELPEPSQYHWEERNAVILNDQDESKYLEIGCNYIVPLIKDALKNPAAPLPQVDPDLQQACRAANLESHIHQSDHLLRKCVSEVIEISSPESKSKVAKEANSVRIKILKEVRSGIVTFGSRKWDFGTLTHGEIKQAITEIFHLSMNSENK